jgi:protein associated with RNAse G/E
MRTEGRLEGRFVKVSTDESARCSVVYSEEFAERKKKKEYKNALSQILQRARKLDW